MSAFYSEFKQRNGATWIDDAQSPREKESVEKSTGADEEEAQSSPSSSKQKKSTAKSTSYSPSDSPSKMAKKSPTPMDIIPLPPSSADKTKGARNQSRQSRILSDTKSSDENEAKFEDLKVDIPTKKKAKKEPAGEEDEGERGRGDVLFKGGNGDGS